MNRIAPPARLHRGVRQILWLIALPLFSSTVWAEGGIRILECDITRICDAGGECKMDSQQLTFRMEPLDIRSDAAANYELSYGNTQAGMRALSDAGPFYWTVDQERDTLLASSEDLFLWHQLAFDPAPVATIRFLTCTFRQ